MTEKILTQQEEMAVGKICYSLIAAASEYLGTDRDLTKTLFDIETGLYEDKPCVKVSLTTLGEEAVIIPVDLAIETESDKVYYEGLRKIAKVAAERLSNPIEEQV